MDRPGRIVVLCMIAILQGVTLVGGFVATRQASEAYSRLAEAYYQLYEETHPDLHLVDLMGLNPPNPFAWLFFPVLLGLILTVALLVGEVFDGTADDSEPVSAAPGSHRVTRDEGV